MEQKMKIQTINQILLQTPNQVIQKDQAWIEAAQKIQEERGLKIAQTVERLSNNLIHLTSNKNI